jgi:hypothetical protein
MPSAPVRPDSIPGHPDGSQGWRSATALAP